LSVHHSKYTTKRASKICWGSLLQQTDVLQRLTLYSHRKLDVNNRAQTPGLKAQALYSVWQDLGRSSMSLGVYAQCIFVQYVRCAALMMPLEKMGQSVTRPPLYRCERSKSILRGGAYLSPHSLCDVLTAQKLGFVPVVDPDAPRCDSAG
jgi:hypothetical protein